ncbi:hypothetical protein AALP_AA5G018800 [Arabis alpina]|uniref:SKP1-like protein n=1 Tax=Arabis alpina TaxID=50452 RepID=A0A087GUC8_ARAAL|nr:hypothetical protein AALP_AA5G018800 [Arabis alpina]
MASSSTNKIVLISGDGISFEVTEAVAREFQPVAHIIEDDCAITTTTISNVTGEILSKMIEYSKKHVEEAPIDEEDKEGKKKLQIWDEEFMKQFNMEILFQLILAADYSTNKGLLDLTCCTVADHIKDMTPDEVRTLFNIENDYTTEEEEEIRKENAWAFE